MRRYNSQSGLCSGAVEADQVRAAGVAFRAYGLADPGCVDHRAVAGDDADVAGGGRGFSRGS